MSLESLNRKATKLNMASTLVSNLFLYRKCFIFQLFSNLHLDVSVIFLYLKTFQ